MIEDCETSPSWNNTESSQADGLLQYKQEDFPPWRNCANCSLINTSTHSFHQFALWTFRRSFLTAPYTAQICNSSKLSTTAIIHKTINLQILSFCFCLLHGIVLFSAFFSPVSRARRLRSVVWLSPQLRFLRLTTMYI